MTINKATMSQIFCLALVAFGIGTNAHANLITNGSFEDTTGPVNYGGANANWKVYEQVTGWTTVSGPGIEIQTNPTLRNIDAQEGFNYVELDAHGGSNTNAAMSQRLTDLTVGSTYQLEFYYQARTNNGNNDNGINVFWDLFTGTDLSTLSYSNEVLSIDNVKNSDVAINGATAANGGWFQFNLDLLATSDTMALTFAADGSDNSLGGLIDNVSVHPVQEPATLGLIALGVAGLLVTGRRKR